MAVKIWEKSKNPAFEGTAMLYHPPGHLTTLAKTTSIANFAYFGEILMKFGKEIKNGE